MANNLKNVVPFFKTTLAAAHNVGGTTLTLTQGTGASVLAAGLPVYLVVIKASAFDSIGQVGPISSVTQYTISAVVGDVLTISSVAFGTDQAFSIGDVVMDAPTAAHIIDLNNAINSNTTLITTVQGTVTTQGTQISANSAAIAALQAGGGGGGGGAVTSVAGRVGAIVLTTVDIGGLTNYALDNSVVHLAGNETVTGVKTFTNGLTGNLTGNSSTASALSTSIASGSLWGGQASGIPTPISVGSGLALSGGVLTATGGGGGGGAVTSVAGRTGAVVLSTTDISGIGSYAVDSTVLHLSGAETVTGAKTFSSTIGGSISGNAATATALGSNLASGTLLGGQGTGIPSTINIGSGLTLSGGTLSATGGGGAVTSVAGRTGAVVLSTSDISGIGSYALDNTVLHLAGAETVTGTKTFSTAIAGSITGNAATATALASNLASGTLLGGQGTGIPSTINVGSGLALSGGTLTATGTAASVFGASGTGHSTGLVPDPGATAGTTRFLREDATWVVVSSSGLTNVVLTLPAAVYSVASSTTSGVETLTVTYQTQTAKTFFSGPASGGAATPTFRTITAGDLPTASIVPTVVAGKILGNDGTNPTWRGQTWTRSLRVGYPGQAAPAAGTNQAGGGFIFPYAGTLKAINVVALDNPSGGTGGLVVNFRIDGTVVQTANFTIAAGTVLPTSFTSFTSATINALSLGTYDIVSVGTAVGRIEIQAVAELNNA